MRASAATLVAVFALLAGAGTVGCGSTREGGAMGVGQPIRPARAHGEAPTLAEVDLEAKRLAKRWDLYLNEPIAGLWQVDDAIYALTTKKRLWSVNVGDGLPRWQYNLPNGLSQAPGAYVYEDDGTPRTDELFLLSENVLHVVDLKHGFLLWKLVLPFSAASPPVGNLSHIYVGGWDNRIYAISKLSHGVDWSYRTGAPVTAPVEPAERSVESVFVGSEDGNVYSMNPVFEERKWHVKTRGRIVAAPLFFRTFIYIASSDMNLYCYRSVDGNLEWKYPAGASLSTSPVAYTPDAVYVVTDDQRLLALNLKTESLTQQDYLRFARDHTTRVLGHGRDVVFVLDRDGSVVALNELTGETRWETPLEAHADFHTLNRMSAKSTKKRERELASTLVFGYRDGWLVSVTEKDEY